MDISTNPWIYHVYTSRIYVVYPRIPCISSLMDIHGISKDIPLRSTYTWYIPGIYQAYTGNRGSRWVEGHLAATVTVTPSQRPLRLRLVGANFDVHSRTRSPSPTHELKLTFATKSVVDSSSARSAAASGWASYPPEPPLWWLDNDVVSSIRVIYFSFSSSRPPSANLKVGSAYSAYYILTQMWFTYFAYSLHILHILG